MEILLSSLAALLPDNPRKTRRLAFAKSVIRSAARIVPLALPHNPRKTGTPRPLAFAKFVIRSAARLVPFALPHNPRKTGTPRPLAFAKFVIRSAARLVPFALLVTSFASAQKSPPMKAMSSIAGRTLSIKYGAPSVRGRQIFGDGGRISQDPNYPVWRAGADPATLFHTDADLQIGDLLVPKGDYSLYVLVKDPDAWQLIINKQVGQWGLEYDPAQDLGRVPMTMTKPPALIEQLKYVISSDGARTGKIQLEWENHIATVAITAK